MPRDRGKLHRYGTRQRQEASKSNQFLVQKFLGSIISHLCWLAGTCFQILGTCIDLQL